jgi:hypothetical protein
MKSKNGKQYWYDGQELTCWSKEYWKVKNLKTE